MKATRMGPAGAGLGAAAAAADPAAAARATPGARPAVFAIVIGVNRSVDVQLAPLSYADDDAFRYRDLFRSVQAPHGGADPARREHPPRSTPRSTRRRNRSIGRWSQAVSHAWPRRWRPPARRAGATVLYFVFAGHGNVGKQGAYLTLEDQRLTGADLDQRVLRAIGADESTSSSTPATRTSWRTSAGPGGKRARGARVLPAGRPAGSAGRGPAAVHLVGAREPRVGGVPGRRVQPRGALGPVRRGRHRRRRRR